MTGIDSTGDKVKNKEIYEEFAKLKVGMSLNNKKRLLYTIVSSLDMTENDYKSLCSGMEERDLKYIKALKNFNLFFSDKKTSDRRKERMTKDEFKKFQKQNEQNNYLQLRSTNVLEDIIDKCSNEELDFPFIHKPNNFFKQSKVNILTNLKNLDIDDEESDCKVVLFVIGGISINEIVSLENLMKGKQNKFKLIIGSTEILTPDKFIEQLSSMKSEADILMKEEEVKLKEIKVQLQE